MQRYLEGPCNWDSATDRATVVCAMIPWRLSIRIDMQNKKNDWFRLSQTISRFSLAAAGIETPIVADMTYCPDQQIDTVR